MTPGAEDEYDDDDDDDDHDDDDNEDAAHDDVDEFVDATPGATDDEDDDNDDDDDDADDDGAPQRRELPACTIEDLQEAPRARREIALRRELLADAPEEPNAAINIIIGISLSISRRGRCDASVICEQTALDWDKWREMRAHRACGTAQHCRPDLRRRLCPA